MSEPVRRRHLFLTGDKQVGKSTLLRRLIDEKQLQCAGFETQLLTIGGERKGFILHGRVSMPPFENDCIVSARIAQQRSVPVGETFSENGVRILRLSMESDAPFILMDEIGKLECGSEPFCRAILSCLDGEKRVLGVLQRCDSPLIDEIAARGDVTVIGVTKENREALFSQLAALIDQP